MRKFLFKSVTALVALCLALFGFAACSDDSVEEEPSGKLSSVDANSIQVFEQVSGMILSWDDVSMAAEYAVTCNEFETTTSSSFLSVTDITGFTFPSDGVLNFTIVAKAYKHTDSDPTNYTYILKGVILDSPQFKSLEAGVLEWGEVSGATAYKVAVNGNAVTDGSDGLYHTTTLDLADYASPETLKVEVSAVGNKGKFLLDSAATTVGVNAEHTKLMLLPITEYKLSGSVITWSPVGGVSGYRVVDLNMHVAKIVKANDTLRYDMAGNNLIIGVFPISADKKVADAEVTPRDIKYLEGEGTQQSPYLVKTPFDLRAVDYYELMYAHKNAEALAAGTAPAGNRYRIESNMNFNSVAALDSESNFYMLSQPFYGYLDGNYKKLSNARVIYDGGYWAMFDYITPNATVRNITFDSAEIENSLKKPEIPLGGSVAAIAKFNYGTISGIVLKDARFSSMAGSVSGVCTHNYGTVKNCEVSGEFIQVSIEALATEDSPLTFNQACFEMGGVVLENYGAVTNNHVGDLTIRGEAVKNVKEVHRDEKWNIIGIDYGDPYNNVRCAGGIVAVNREEGVVSSNSYETINFVKVNGDFKGQEFGGIVAYNAGEIRYSENQLGKFTCTDADSVGSAITQEQGTASNHRGTVVGKSQGTVVKG